MARIQACVKVVAIHSGTTDQVVTSVVDHRGSPFAPSAFLVLGHGTLNTIETAWRVCYGFDTGTGAAYGNSGVSFNFAGAKAVRGAYGTASLIQATESVGGGRSRVASLTNVTAGTFTIAFTTNAINGDSVVILCLGGTDLDVAISVGSGVAKQTTTFEPTGAIFQHLNSATTADGVSPALSLGWATSAGQHGCLASACFQIGGNDRYQRTTKIGAIIGGGGVGFEYAVASWQTDGFTVDAALPISWAYLALGGCSMVGGASTVPAAPGAVTLSPGIKVRALLLMSNGAAASTSVRTDEAAMALGVADSARQAAHWTSEDAVFGPPPNGARYLSDDDVLVIGTVNGGSSTIHTRAQVTSLDPFAGTATLNFSAVDGTEPQFTWLAIGEAVGGDPPVDYEDPCSITEPRIFATVETETETLKFGVQPLRDSSALGGYAEPRLLDVSPVTRVASDVATGAWSAQTASMRWADTDRVNRERSETRTSFRSCDATIYLTSNAQRLAGLPPRVLFAGSVYEDTADENLVLSQTINDLIGSNYSLFSEEKQIPQRVIEKNWFPNAPDGSLGQAEPIVGGRRAPLDPAALAAVPLPEGVSKGVYVGQVRINGAHGTPTGGDLATVVAALEASRAGGTLYTDYGSRIGYSDATVLQGYGSVPSDYDALAQVIGYGDLDALIAETSHTGGDLFEAVVLASHAISEILDANDGNPSIWVGDTQVGAGDIGVSVWCPQIPGDTSWASDIGATKYTDVLGADGTTRRYTLVLFDPASAHGIAVAGGAVVHVDCVGMEDVGDGTGDALTDYFALYRHVLINFILQDYQAGAWLASPQFLFSDGVTLLDRVDSESFDMASTVAALTLTGGYLGSFTVDTRSSVRDVVANYNFSGGCLLAQDDFGRLLVKVLDTRRTNFLTGRYTGTAHRTLRDKVDILPGMRIDAKPDWQVNRLTYQYARNNFTGSYERDAGGGGNTVFIEDATSQTRGGVIRKTVEFPYLRDDATADAVANYYLQLFKDLPRVVTYTRRGLCGLEDDVLDGVPITHFNGYGAAGWVNHAVWIIGKTFNPKTLTCSFTALDVEARLVSEETVVPDALLLDPVALEALYADVGGEPLYADT